MKDRFLHIIMLVAAIGICACERIDNASDRYICLGAGVDEMEVNTKNVVTADPYNGSVPTEDNKLNAAVWFSITDGVFMHDPTEPAYLPCRTSMLFEGDAKTTANYDEDTEDSTPAVTLKYPTGDDTEVYCIGLYPSVVGGDNGWKSDDGIKISHSISGQDDLMFADQISGTWRNPFPDQQYNHLLTWVKINFCAMTMEAARQWGNVQTVTITSDATVEIDLSETGDERITYTGSNVITTFQNTEDIPLTLTNTEAGSVFCSPETSYTVTITTTNYPEGRTVPITLTDLEYAEIEDPSEAVGKLFIISLYFSPFNVIEGTCTLNYWNDQNEDLFLQ